MGNIKRGSLVLAGDIGGTKTHLGLFKPGKRRPVLQTLETYASPQAPNLESIISEFLHKYPTPITRACFGIAGPVVNGQCATTNLPWNVSEKGIKNRFEWPGVRLINDLTAMAQAIPLLNSKERFALNNITAKKGHNLALLAPGTGLGEALLIFKDGQYIPVSSEGGHVDFSPNREADISLWRYLRRRFGHVSMERIISGPGLFNIYSWLKHSGQYREPQWLSVEMKGQDPAMVIAKAAEANKHPLCVETLNMFLRILGAAAGNLALTAMAMGGLYLGGGIPPKILPKLKEDIFMNAFVNKGRFQGLMEKIPVRVILNDKSALLGAAYNALNLRK